MLNVTKKKRERNGDGINVLRQTIQEKSYGLETSIQQQQTASKEVARIFGKNS
jgi:hypothetical protein